jgi:hypothetical protein
VLKGTAVVVNEVFISGGGTDSVFLVDPPNNDPKENDGKGNHPEDEDKDFFVSSASESLFCKTWMRCKNNGLYPKFLDL